MLLQSGHTDNAERQQNFASWLKRIGEGTETTYPIHGKDAILLPNEFCVGCKPNDDMQILIDRVYGDLQTIHDWNERMTYIVEQAILTPLNKDVDIINNYIGKNTLQMRMEHQHKCIHISVQIVQCSRERKITICRTQKSF